jgi:hypothetical protein
MRIVALSILVLFANCGSSGKNTRATERRPMNDPKVEQLVKELEPEALGGLPAAQATEARAELSELAADWLREAGNDRDAAEILALLRTEFHEKLDGKSPMERRDIVRWQSVERRLRRLSVQSYALGKKVVDGTIADDQARTEGEALMAASDAITARWKAIVDPQAKANIQRDLGEVQMEALYAIEKKAMSLRLGRYAAHREGGPKITP